MENILVYFLGFFCSYCLRIKTCIDLKVRDGVMTSCSNFLRWTGIGFLGTLFGHLSFASSNTFDSSAFSKTYHLKLERMAQELNKRAYMTWDIQSYGESYSSPMDKASLFSLKGRGRLNYRILDRVTLKTQANILFQGVRLKRVLVNCYPQGLRI